MNPVWALIMLYSLAAMTFKVNLCHFWATSCFKRADINCVKARKVILMLNIYTVSPASSLGQRTDTGAESADNSHVFDGLIVKLNGHTWLSKELFV